MERVRVAAAAYPVDFLTDWAAFEAKLTRWVADAAGQGAELLVFPEYAPLELVSLRPAGLHHDVIGMRPALQAFVPEFVALHARLAREYGVGIVAGSYPVAHAGAFVNRAFVFGPDGTQGHQDKLLMTRFEAEEWHVAPGEGVLVKHRGILARSSQPGVGPAAPPGQRRRPSTRLTADGFAGDQLGERWPPAAPCRGQHGP